MYQTTKKRASGPKCPVTGKRIQGVCHFFFPFRFNKRIALLFSIVFCNVCLLARRLMLANVFYFSLALPDFCITGKVILLITVNEN